MTHAADLRAAAARTPDRALADLLTVLADTAEHPSDAAIGLTGAVLHRALAVARLVPGTTDQQPATARFCGRADCLAPGHRYMLGSTVHTCAGKPETAPAGTELRDRIRRAVCEAEGFAWDTDMLEPDEYGEVADAVLAVLPAPTDRAAVLREGADFVAELLKETPEYGVFVAETLRRMADEAQQPATEASPTAALLAARCDRCQHVLNNHLRYGACLHDGCTCRRFEPAP